MSESSKYIDVTKARSDEQLRQFQEIDDEGICPFCPEHLERFHTKAIMHRTHYWQATENMVPYENANKHYLLIPFRHMVHISEVTSEEWSDLKVAVDILALDIAYGGLAMRFGDFTYTGASVAHLHIHIFEPDKNEDGAHKLKFKISR